MYKIIECRYIEQLNEEMNEAAAKGYRFKSMVISTTHYVVIMEVDV